MILSGLVLETALNYNTLLNLEVASCPVHSIFPMLTDSQKEVSYCPCQAKQGADILREVVIVEEERSTFNHPESEVCPEAQAVGAQSFLCSLLLHTVKAQVVFKIKKIWS